MTLNRLTDPGSESLFDVAFTSSNSPGLEPTHSFGAVPLLLAVNVHVISSTDKRSKMKHKFKKIKKILIDKGSDRFWL